LISLGHTLGLTVVAEGVETRQQHAFLQSRGCSVFQGFLFSRPVDVASFEAVALQKRVA
jgi:EAL domain-containing protein (putative c-di-GMP-specific phosphodiesterase class I)